MEIDVDNFTPYALLFLRAGTDHTVIVLLSRQYQTKTLRVSNQVVDNVRAWIKAGGNDEYTLVNTDKLRITLPADLYYADTVNVTQRSMTERLAAPQAIITPSVMLSR
jgi:hypothetical protein